MHYKNGREAKPGDRVVDLESGATGILHSTNEQSDTCNGRLAQTAPTDPCVSLKECLHMDDVAAIAVVVPDVSHRPH